MIKLKTISAYQARDRGREIYAQYCGLKSIPRGHCVHHIDGNPFNNDIDNLILLENAIHTQLHRKMKLRASWEHTDTFINEIRIKTYKNSGTKTKERVTLQTLDSLLTIYNNEL